MTMLEPEYETIRQFTRYLEGQGYPVPSPDVLDIIDEEFLRRPLLMWDQHDDEVCELDQKVEKAENTVASAEEEIELACREVLDIIDAHEWPDDLDAALSKIVAKLEDLRSQSFL